MGLRARPRPKCCHLLAKPSGGIRLIEAPKDRLRTIQQRILRGILERIPPHPAATGFRRGTSLLDYVAPHVGRSLVIHMDLRHFFPSIGTGRIAGLFRCAGYPESVAASLARLCLAAFRFDRRLHGLAVASGAVYSRYADDLAFSWPDAQRPHPRAFIARAEAILLEEGFEPNARKTHVLGRGMSQRPAGVVLNPRCQSDNRTVFSF